MPEGRFEFKAGKPGAANMCRIPISEKIRWEEGKLATLKDLFVLIPNIPDQARKLGRAT